MNYRNNTSFLMKYKPEDFFTLNEIDLSGSQGHVISDAEINEINKYNNRLLYLYMLNVSQNSIMKLFLFNFVNLKVIDASKNIITTSLKILFPQAARFSNKSKIRIIFGLSIHC